MNHFETVWTFRTAHFSVELAVAPEDMDPADQFEDAENLAFASEGGWHWFQARVQVAFVDSENPKNWATTRNCVLGKDYLGGCSYHGLKDFRKDGYFRNMVAEAITEARGTLARMCAAA